MNDKGSQLPKDIYHRLYWYAKRKVDPARIAAALNLSIKTVNHILGKLADEANNETEPKKKDPVALEKDKPASDDFLDVFVYTKTRYSVVDISGCIDKDHIRYFRETFLKISTSDRKPIALKMTDVLKIDETGVGSLKTLYTGMKHQNRYCAILDPSPVAEDALRQYGLDAILPIFGTELAFEEHAFK